MNEILREQWSYILYSDRGQDYYLSVLCGTVAQYDINIKLLPDEVQQYKQNGTSFINELAAQIRYNPQAFYDRHIKELK